jgi:hypothetical protein
MVPVIAASTATQGMERLLRCGSRREDGAHGSDSTARGCRFQVAAGAERRQRAKGLDVPSMFPRAGGATVAKLSHVLFLGW